MKDLSDRSCVKVFFLSAEWTPIATAEHEHS